MNPQSSTETAFQIKDMNKKLYSLHFKHQLFWEIGFLEGTCTVYSKNGALTKNGDKILGSIEDEGIKTHENIVSAVLDVQARINKKLLGGFTLEDFDAIPNFQDTPGASSSDQQINQKRSAKSQGYDISAKESLLKKLHASKMSNSSETSTENTKKENPQIKTDENHSENNAQDFSFSSEDNEQNEDPPAIKYHSEERKGAYLEKLEAGETLFYKIQISQRKLMIEEGKLNDPRNQPTIQSYFNAQQEMEFLIKKKEKEGYKNITKKFVYDFRSKVRSQKKAAKLNDTTQQDSLPKRSLRNPSEKNYATHFPESPSHKTKSYFTGRQKDWPEWKDPTGFILREKRNGILCTWNGKDQFTSRYGHQYKVPKEFIQGFPSVSLYGFICLGSEDSHAVEMNMKCSNYEKWKDMIFVAYDIMDTKMAFKKRMERLEELLKEIDARHIEFCKYIECKDSEHFEKEKQAIQEKQGEGLFVNNPNCEGLNGADAGRYLWNSYIYEEAELLDYVYDENGNDIKSLKVRHLKGKNNVIQIYKGVGTLESEEIPKIGDLIIYKTVGQKSKNVPKAPVFVKIKSPEETEESPK